MSYWTETTPITPNNLNKLAYPVGSIYINATNNENPATLLGYGEWERFGEGRVLVSQDSGDEDFGDVGATGGSKTHQLTVDEMPSHNHSYTRDSFSNRSTTSNNFGVQDGTFSDNTGSTGGDSPHNNLQPYITVYMWVRTA